jgi:serine/threonine-protein phosphatase with EF-hand domain
VEVVLVLFTLLQLYPNDVYLNRGNHEDYIINMKYGFTKEIELKYKHHAQVVCAMFQDVFKWLPLGCLIDGKVLVVHGGVSQETDIKYLQNIKRSKYVSLLKPVGIDKNDVDQMQEWRQVVDLLWSDPQASEGCKRNEHRGSGKHFGPDVSQSVLSRNGIELLVRSHQCKPDGYEYTHKGKVAIVTMHLNPPSCL